MNKIEEKGSKNWKTSKMLILLKKVESVEDFRKQLEQVEQNSWMKDIQTWRTNYRELKNCL